jgi:hypothetical protein
LKALPLKKLPENYDRNLNSSDEQFMLKNNFTQKQSSKFAKITKNAMPRVGK